MPGFITVALKPFYFLRAEFLHTEPLAHKPIAQVVEQPDMLAR
jgi:hypothetical protein